MLNSREFIQEDLPLFMEWIRSSPEWEALETDASLIEDYMKKYEMYDGKWLVWEKNKEPAAVTYTLDWAPSNEKAWLGTIVVNPSKRRSGIGKAVLGMIRGEFKEKGDKVIFAGVPEERQDWILFLSAAGFEQFKLEEKHMIMLLPLQ